MKDKGLCIGLIVLLGMILFSFITMFNGNILYGIMAMVATMGCVNGFCEFIGDLIKVLKKHWK